ncbi:UNVERIFIED_CONTAM: hypothetical protein FKN15_046687 [Acipenser sinensis]
MPALSCRFYQHKFPEVEDVVMVNVRSIAEMGAYVSLLEYNNLRQPAGVQQHRGHDPAERAVQEAHPLHQQAYSHRPQRVRGGHPSGQRESTEMFINDQQNENTQKKMMSVWYIRISEKLERNRKLKQGKVNHPNKADALTDNDTECYIDLSKRRVSPEEAIKCEDKFTKSKTVYSILRHVAEVLEYTKDEQLESLFQRTAWVFDEKYKRPGYGAYDAFKQAVSDPAILDCLDLTEEEKNVLIDNINRRLTPQAVKIRADIEVACYGYEGIDAVKESLRAGLSCSTEAMPIKINLIAPPRYVMTTMTLERTEGLSVLNQAMSAIKEKIEEKRGVFNIQMEAKVVTDTDETELARQLERLERENAEVDGDDDAEEMEAKAED